MSEDLRTGEQRERERRNRKALLVAGIGVAGLVTGFLIGMREADNLFTGGTSSGWPPAMAIGIVLSYLAAVIGGGVAVARQTDEVELLAQYKAVAAASLSYVLAYPIWFVLWMGNLAPEPMHAVLYGLFWLALAGALIFYKFR